MAAALGCADVGGRNMSWLELFIPWSRMDAGLWLLLIAWLGIVAAGVRLWWRHRDLSANRPTP